MVRSRMFIVLGGCFLMASAAWADGVAYIDCAAHPEDTQVFPKPRRMPESVAGLPCGERFTVLLNGFIFSRIQTKDGQIGYIYSNLISPDRSGASVPSPTSARVNAAPAKATNPAVQPPATAPAQAQVVEAPTTHVQAIPVQPKPAQAPAAAANVQVAPSTPTQTLTTPPQPAQSQASAATSNAPETTGESVKATLPTPTLIVEAERAPVSSGAPVSNAPETHESTAQPDAGAASQPEAAPAEPAAPAIRPVSARESWEKPNAGAIRRMPLIELFGGYGFARFDNGAGTAASNLNGVLGSFGWNVKPWLQIVADSSYNVVTVTGTKNVLYGNHWGPRIFRRVRNRWGITPFVEGLVGGTRADTTVSGTGGYKTSDNCISYKVGGGLDIKPSRRFEIRLFDVDYYRTSFGPNLHQNNYWASAGIVLRLFGGSE